MLSWLRLVMGGSIAPEITTCILKTPTHLNGNDRKGAEVVEEDGQNCEGTDSEHSLAESLTIIDQVPEMGHNGLNKIR
jgi:hypothetical protein